MLRKPIAILADLQGPKIRTGTLAGGRRCTLRAGQTFHHHHRGILPAIPRAVNTTFTPLPHEVQRGRPHPAFRRADRTARGAGPRREVICQVVNGGALGEHKGINLPGVRLRVPALTPKDRRDLAFALEHDADYMAVSFVRRPEDVLQAKAADPRRTETIRR